VKWKSFRAEAESIKLYGYWRSSCSWRVRWALNLKEVAYEYVPVNLLKDENRSPEHLKRNALGALPVLEINNEFYLSQSLPILEWIDEVYALKGPSLFPGTPLERAHVRALCEIINADTGPIVMPRVQKAASPDPAGRTAWVQPWIREGLKAFDITSHHSRGQFSFQDRVSAADLCLIPQIYNARRYEIDVQKEFPELFRIWERCLATESCLKASPEQQPDAPKS
jgi:maleylacetoacetate isomerase